LRDSAGGAVVQLFFSGRGRHSTAKWGKSSQFLQVWHQPIYFATPRRQLQNFARGRAHYTSAQLLLSSGNFLACPSQASGCIICLWNGGTEMS